MAGLIDKAIQRSFTGTGGSYGTLADTAVILDAVLAPARQAVNSVLHSMGRKRVKVKIK